MTDVEKLLALVTIQRAAMTTHQAKACNEAWLKLVAEAANTEPLPAFGRRDFLPADDNDGDDIPLNWPDGTRRRDET